MGALGSLLGLLTRQLLIINLRSCAGGGPSCASFRYRRNHMWTHDDFLIAALSLAGTFALLAYVWAPI